MLSKRQTSKPKRSPEKRTRPPDDFVSVARRLGADEDKARFEKNLGKIARTKANVRKSKP